MSEELKQIKITWICPECKTEQTTEFDFKGAVSGIMKFWCKQCDFSNELTMSQGSDK